MRRRMPNAGRAWPWTAGSSSPCACFLFEVSGKGNDYPVYWYDHDQNTVEAVAGNFAQCVKRFVERN